MIRKQKITKMLAIALASAMAAVSFSGVSMEAAAEPKLSRKSVTLKAGNSKTVKIKAQKAKIKSVKWSVKGKGSSIIKLSKQSKKGVTIKGIKKGNAVVTVTIKTAEKSYQRTVNVTVKKKLQKEEEKEKETETGVTADEKGGLNKNNPSYLVLENTSNSPAGIANTGFLDGLSVKKDANYHFSVYARGMDGYTGPVHVALVKNDTEILAEGEIPAITDDWKQYELTLTSKETAYATKGNLNIKLQVTIDKGKAAIDMVSLFPEDTYNGRKNGLRKDLVEKLKELSPKFLRFPGGCIIEGADLSVAYDWKDSIGVGDDGEPLEFNGTYGDVAARKQGQNIWTDERTTNDPYPSFMTYGLGFYEYFLLAEDLGAIGVPVLNCGISCMGQAPATGAEVTKDLDSYIKDALDLVEFCRGDSSTKWGKVRIAMGHTEPFALKYVGIGNEQWGDKFFEHYEAFVDAFDKAKQEKPELYGEIELMFSAGIDDGDSGRANYIPAYERAAKWLLEHPGKTINDFAGVVDHHYYNEPSWFLKNADYYDEKNYSRDTSSMTETKFGGGIQVFLGEYASFHNTLESALAEAAYMTGLERNGDIVKMAAYAPLFGNLTALHWAPDMIWFNNHTSTSSINYYVQKIFSKNAGTKLLATEFDGKQTVEKPLEGTVGVGTWMTSANFDNIKVINNDTKQVIAEDDFSADHFSQNWEKVSDGSWSVKDGKLVQSSTSTDTNAHWNTGTVAYYKGGSDWKNYTYTLEATKTGGEEGFLIPFSVKGSENNYFWNIGGWGNTVSCLQQVKDNAKSDQLLGTVKECRLENGRTYQLKIEVSDYHVKCYLDNELYVDYEIPKETASAECYQVVSTDETGDIIIKMVNVTGEDKTAAIKITGADLVGTTAKVETVAGDRLNNDNRLGEAEEVTLKSLEATGISNQFNYTLPKYSVTVLRIKTKEAKAENKDSSAKEGTVAVSAYDKAKADYPLEIDAGKTVHEISDMLYGIFFEDINFAADGGFMQR